ncbi:Alcohol dehydrogenase [acceptor] [Galdieria sulphuraria]|nr:Alcohol dehydrogenase [acceptor] [Galdieria sulphuraria]
MKTSFISCCCLPTCKSSKVDRKGWKRAFLKVLKRKKSLRAYFWKDKQYISTVPVAASLENDVHNGFDRSREFDYVIVGGGAAGCVLASRLSEDRSSTVLLLEAGKEDSNFYIHVPMGFPYLVGSDLDWKYQSANEEKLFDRKVIWPRGKVLGGSHTISVALYLRGSANDYRDWEKSGATGWGPEDVLPYFLKAENNLRGASAYHGKGGPLKVSDLPSPNEMSQAFVIAGQTLDIPCNKDFNDWSHSQEGIGFFQVTQADGKRVSPATAYLHPVRGRRNLFVETQKHVEKILFAREMGSAPRALGVSYINANGERERAMIRKEVILSAGAYGSPQLLMLSGIGPPDILAPLGIPVVMPLHGVGKNLQDHCAVLFSCKSPNPSEDRKHRDLYYTEETGKDWKTILTWVVAGKGPLTSTMCEAGAFLKTNPIFNDPDLQLRFIPFFSEADPYFSLSDYSSKGMFFKNRSHRPSGFTIQSVAIRPKSRDLETLLRGISLSQKLVHASPLASYFGEQCFPSTGLSKKEDIIRYISSTCHTANAVVGTCRMGTDKQAVVNPNLQVMGVERLRVVDASIMPCIPGGQTGAPTIMIAEKAADMIRGKLSLKANFEQNVFK